MSVILELQNIKKYFPIKTGKLFSKKVEPLKAVDGISFSINEGETFALVGESGCGKSTTAKVALLLEEKTAGSIHFNGEEVSEIIGNKLKLYRSQVQAVFQDPYASLDPRMRIGPTVAEPLIENKHLSKKMVLEKIKEVLAQVGLDSKAAERFPHEFSGGQRQRIAVARSLILGPRMIILDEPVSALDVSIQAQIMNLLKDIQEETGTAYLLIAHDLATVRYMSNHLGVMYLGRIVECGKMKDVYHNQLHPYTKALFSAALPYHPDIQKEEIVLSGEMPSPLHPPSGCRFHERCFCNKPICSEVEPELREVSPGYWIACHLC
ncbi:ABC transporter ATP-binding protein [Thermodesulfobacteriota bacterium]